MQNRSYSASAKDIVKTWFIIDAKNAVIGRLAVYVANILRGKHKAIYTPHIDCGDNVIIINANLAKFTGKKFADKVYYYFQLHFFFYIFSFHTSSIHPFSSLILS